MQDITRYRWLALSFVVISGLLVWGYGQRQRVAVEIAIREAQVAALEARLDALEAQTVREQGRLEQRFGLLLVYVVDLRERLAREGRALPPVPEDAL